MNTRRLCSRSSVLSIIMKWFQGAEVKNSVEFMSKQQQLTQSEASAARDEYYNKLFRLEWKRCKQTETRRKHEPSQNKLRSSGCSSSEWSSSICPSVSHSVNNQAAGKLYFSRGTKLTVQTGKIHILMTSHCKTLIGDVGSSFITLWFWHYAKIQMYKTFVNWHKTAQSDDEC